MNITFEGAARSVTGSCYLLEANGKKLLVDCGMRQGEDAKTDDGAFSFAPGEVDAVLITHAHIDHTGLLPLLVEQGFKGTMFATKVTRELCSIMLPDSGHIQEMEAEWRTRKAVRAGLPPVKPLYTAQQAVETAEAIVAMEYEEVFEVVPGVMACFLDAGHLLGSAMICLWVKEDGVQKQIVFSGDLGNSHRPIVRDPSLVQQADLVVMESTYGDRDHPSRSDGKAALAAIIKQTFRKGGNVVIPAFSVGRTQELLYDLSSIMRERREGLSAFDVYVDSPLSSKATKVFAQNFNDGYFDEEAMARKRQGDNPFLFDTVHFVESAEDSKALNTMGGSKVIISSSGMCEAGRIKHHLKHNLYRSECAVVFAGYQGVGTLGRSLVEGAQKVRLFGEQIEVNASIHRLEGFSGHADQKGLLHWIDAFAHHPQVMVTHGEAEVAMGFAALLEQRGFQAYAPAEGEALDLATGELKEASASQTQAKQRQSEPVDIPTTQLVAGDINRVMAEQSQQMMQTAALLEAALLRGDLREHKDSYHDLVAQMRQVAREMARR